MNMMDCSSTPEPAYLTLPGWRCIPVYAVPMCSSTSCSSADPSSPSVDPNSLIPAGISCDPRQWSRQHVYTWLEWCVDHFSLPHLDLDQFHMNGRALCLLKKCDLRDRAPRSGDILFNALHLLLQKFGKSAKGSSNGINISSNISASLLQDATQEKGLPVWPRSISSDFHCVGHVVHESEPTHMTVSQLGGTDVDSTTAVSPTPSTENQGRSEFTGVKNGLTKLTEKNCIPESPRINCNRPVSPSDGPNVPNSVNLCLPGSEVSSEKISVRLLWDFLQQLLNDPQQRYNNCIIWKDKLRGVFKITDPHHLASLWGMQKNHLNMNFDKMSRALRYYYRVRILQKEPGERHCYRFLRHPNELRHCKQRALLSQDADNTSGFTVDCSDTEAALDMSIKDEGSSPGDTE